ncbi:MAG: hypothetical protein KDB27_16455 [Planctomycetales bacterium]|nr:hypothetical protein [Planctomycetales bacterium]
MHWSKRTFGLTAILRATGGSKERLAKSQWWSLCGLLFLVMDVEKKWRQPPLAADRKAAAGCGP